MIISPATENCIGACAAFNRIVGFAANQRVIAVTAEELVGPSAAC